MKCKYCNEAATKTLVWLYDRHQQPARIEVPYCGGCDLMTALRKIWPNASPVSEGIHYEICPLFVYNIEGN